MKPVVLVCGPPRDAVGGGPTHVRNLLGSPLASEFDLVLFETGSRGAESPAKDEPLPAALARLATAPFALAALLARRRPAVAHVNTAMTLRGIGRDALTILICRLFGCHVILQLHGGYLAAATRSPFTRALVRATLGAADAVVLLARSERAEYERFGVRRIVVVPNAVDTRVFRGEPERVHSGAIRRAGFLARLIPSKGVFESLEAVQALRAEPAFAGLELLIAGSGPAREELERRIANDGLTGVHLLGSLSGERVAGFLRECDVLLLPTYHREGLPYTILESLAAGTPVVTTRNAGIVDVVRDREHGIFVEPRDAGQVAAAIRELAASPEGLRAMSRACASWAERELGLERLARQFAALYRALGATS